MVSKINYLIISLLVLTSKVSLAQASNATRMDSLLNSYRKSGYFIFKGQKIKDKKEFEKDSILAVFMANNVMNNTINSEIITEFCNNNSMKYLLDTIENNKTIRYYFKLNIKKKLFKKREKFIFEHTLLTDNKGLKKYKIASFNEKSLLIYSNDEGLFTVIDNLFLQMLKYSLTSNNYFFPHPFDELDFYNYWPY